MLTDGGRSLPDLLREYEQYGGVVANWRILGSSESAAGGGRLGRWAMRRSKIERSSRCPGRPLLPDLTLLLSHHSLPAGGHRSKQKSTVLSYTKCMPVDVGDQLLVKSIVNTALTVFPAAPHNASYVGGCHAGAATVVPAVPAALAGSSSRMLAC